MQQFISTFRLWWKKPRSVSDRPEKREVSFLELFYDLAFVVIVIQLTHSLVGHLTLPHLLEYIGMYAMVWFAWVTGSMYYELHGNNDIRTRVFTFLQMFCLVWMGVFVHTAFTPYGYQGFALAYASFLAIMTYLWWRTGVHDQEHRPLSQPYALAFLVATLAFVASTRVSLEMAERIWFPAVAFCLLAPIVLLRVRRGVDADHLEKAQQTRSSLVERFGLLTIIVLGENLISIVSGAAEVEEFNWPVVSLISLCMLIVFSLWWVYFDFVSRRMPRQTTATRMTWIYLHLPLTMSIGLTAVGLLNLIEHPEAWHAIDRWFVVGPLIVFLLVITQLVKTLQTSESVWPIYHKGRVAAGVAAGLLVVVGFLGWSQLTTLVVVWLLLTLPVFAGFKVWLGRQTQVPENTSAQ